MADGPSPPKLWDRPFKGDVGKPKRRHVHRPSAIVVRSTPDASKWNYTSTVSALNDALETCSVWRERCSERDATIDELKKRMEAMAAEVTRLRIGVCTSSFLDDMFHCGTPIAAEEVLQRMLDSITEACGRRDVGLLCAIAKTMLGAHEVVARRNPALVGGLAYMLLSIVVGLEALRACTHCIDPATHLTAVISVQDSLVAAVGRLGDVANAVNRWKVITNPYAKFYLTCIRTAYACLVSSEAGVVQVAGRDHSAVAWPAGFAGKLEAVHHDKYCYGMVSLLAMSV